MPFHSSALDDRVTCSSISLRHRPFAEAADVIASLGFRSIDLGALPGVCDHVPVPLTPEAATDVAAVCTRHRLAVVSINADIGDLNVPADAALHARRRAQLDALLDLAAAVGAGAVVLPCGSPGPDPIADVDTDLRHVADALRGAAEQAAARGIELWVEAQHSLRLCHSTERAARLMSLLDDVDVGVVMDFSHVVASQDDLVAFVEQLGPRIRHVHLRDAVPGDIHLSVGRGEVDFAAGIGALEAAGFTGQYSLELETRDVTEDERPAAALEAGTSISTLVRSRHEETVR
jgi:sugar phosphate isomerase/epimerase